MTSTLRNAILLTLIATNSALFSMDNANKIKLAILVSGIGSNMEAIIQAIKHQPQLADAFEPCVVISNRKATPALEKATRLGVPTAYLNGTKQENPNEGDYSKKLITCLAQHGVTPENGLLCLAGFMKILEPDFVRHFKNKILNIHPSLLPAFPGLDAIDQALDYGVKVTGPTVHFVDEGVDTGAIIKQTPLTIRQNDTHESLAGRIHVEEHRLYVEVLTLIAQKRISIEGRKVRIAPPVQYPLPSTPYPEQ